MREIKVKLYQFNELSKTAKEKARQWFREGYDGSFEWEYIQQDAKNVGLIIKSLDQHRANKGHFERLAENTAERILTEHGEVCNTYRTAKTFLDSLKALPRDEEGELSLYDQDKAEILEEEFLHGLLEDYRIMLDSNIEYANSDECVDENILANEYEFIENGERT